MKRALNSMSELKKKQLKHSEYMIVKYKSWL